MTPGWLLLLAGLGLAAGSAGSLKAPRLGSVATHLGAVAGLAAAFAPIRAELPRPIAELQQATVGAS